MSQNLRKTVAQSLTYLFLNSKFTPVQSSVIQELRFLQNYIFSLRFPDRLCQIEDTRQNLVTRRRARKISFFLFTWKASPCSFQSHAFFQHSYNQLLVIPPEISVNGQTINIPQKSDPPFQRAHLKFKVLLISYTFKW